MKKPLPKELKTLLRWAIKFVEKETDCLEECHMNPHTQTVEPLEVGNHIRRARRWIEKAKAALK